MLIIQNRILNNVPNCISVIMQIFKIAKQQFTIYKRNTSGQTFFGKPNSMKIP